MSKWQHCKFDNWRWLFLFSFVVNVNEQRIIAFNWKVFFYEVRCAHNYGDVVNFTTVACRISPRLKWYKNYKNRLRLDKVIVKNKKRHVFLWFTVYTPQYSVSSKSSYQGNICIKSKGGLIELHVKLLEWESWRTLFPICRHMPPLTLTQATHASNGHKLEAINRTDMNMLMTNIYSGSSGRKLDEWDILFHKPYSL